MIKLTDDDSVPRVEDAVERHMRLCSQNPGGDKYKTIILPSYNDIEAKILAHKLAAKNASGALDSIRLSNSVLNDVIRDVQCRAKEYDRNNAGSHMADIIFPGGNITPIISTSDEYEPELAHGVAQRILSLGKDHALYSNAATIETAVTVCKAALAQRKVADDATTDAWTALILSKNALGERYNANYFLAATDVNKEYAEKLFPKIDPPKKKKSSTTTTTTTKTS
jgi:hypothetical protein